MFTEITFRGNTLRVRGYGCHRYQWSKQSSNCPWSLLCNWHNNSEDTSVWLHCEWVHFLSCNRGYICLAFVHFIPLITSQTGVRQIQHSQVFWKMVFQQVVDGDFECSNGQDC